MYFAAKRSITAGSEYVVFSITWHQWHHTASRSRITKRFSAAARANTSSPQPLHFSSSANEGDAASTAMANAAMRDSFMTAPGRQVFSQLRGQQNPGSVFPAMSRESEAYQVEASRWPAAFTKSRSSEAAPGPDIASHMKAAK